MKKPIIGITLDFFKDSSKYAYSNFPWYALRQDYSNCIKKAGGIPILIPYEHELIDELLDLIDGLLIPGGDMDISPKLYGQEISSNKVVPNEERTLFEFAFTKKALERDIPFLGICNGMQLLNVVQGGTLFQHLPDSVPNNIGHEQPAPKNIPYHPIKIVPETILYNLTANNQLMVNSTHHQAISKLGNDLIISALAPDGVIEAIELTTKKFAIGVEWHPEYLNTNPLDINLFKEFIRIANDKKR